VKVRALAMGQEEVEASALALELPTIARFSS
jgi:hypothetical protein